MARAYGFESYFTLLKGASGTGIFPPEGSTPVLQPTNERELGYPQIVFVLATTTGINDFNRLTHDKAHVEGSDALVHDHRGRW